MDDLPSIPYRPISQWSSWLQLEMVDDTLVVTKPRRRYVTWAIAMGVLLLIPVALTPLVIGAIGLSELVGPATGGVALAMVAMFLWAELSTSTTRRAIQGETLVFDRRKHEILRNGAVLTDLGGDEHVVVEAVKTQGYDDDYLVTLASEGQRVCEIEQRNDIAAMGELAEVIADFLGLRLDDRTGRLVERGAVKESRVPSLVYLSNSFHQAPVERPTSGSESRTHDEGRPQ